MTNHLSSEISRNYAKALFCSLNTKKAQEDIKKEFGEVVDTVNSSNDLNLVMNNSSVSSVNKVEIIKEIFENKIDIKLLNLLKILVSKHRFNELSLIYDEYNNLLYEKSNKKVVEVVSSVELDKTSKDIIKKSLDLKLSCTTEPVWSVDEDIIAGLVFRFDDYVIDTSVAAKLKRMSKNI